MTNAQLPATPILTTLNTLCVDSPDMVFYKDIDGVYLGCNQAFCDFVGQASEVGIIGATDLDLFNQELANFFGKNTLSALNSNTTKCSTQWITDTYGNNLQLNIIRMPLRDSKDNIIGVLGIIHNITKQQQAQTALQFSNETQQESAQRYQLQFEASRDALLTASPPFKHFSEANQATLNMFGASSLAEMTSLGPEDVSPEYQPDGSLSREKAQKEIETAMRAGSNFFEWQHQKLDGTAFLTNVALTRMEVGGKVFLHSVIRDISERKQVEQQLQESEEKYRRLFDLSEDPMWLIVDDHFVMANQSSAKILGYESVETLSNTHPSKLSPEFQPDGQSSYEKANTMMATAYRTGYHRFEWSHKKKNGETLPVEVSLTRIPYEGKEALFCIWRDISERQLANLELAEKEEQFRSLVENIPGSSYRCQLDEHWTMLFISNEIETLSGYPASDFIGTDATRTFASIMHPDDIQPIWENTNQAVNNKTYYINEYRIIDVQGLTHHVYAKGQAIYDVDGNPKYLDGTIVDVTENKAAEDKLKLAASVFSHAREGIIITNSEGNIIEVNDTFSKITGYTRKEVLNKNPRILKSGRQPPEFYVDMWETLQQEGAWTGELWNRRKNGGIYAELLTISAVHNSTGEGVNYVALFTDITEKKTHQKQLHRMAHYDALTNLPNRVLLADRLGQAMIHAKRQNRSVAVLFLDLDGFKEVNDNYGHHIGDELLIEISHHLKKCLRDADTLSRIGGDEFIAILTDVEKIQDCEPFLDRLLNAAATPYTTRNAVLKASVSIGVTIYPQDGSDADVLIRHADQAMYTAKQEGKNRYHLFDTKQDIAVKTQRESIQDIRSALNNNEFVLHYQPQVNMKTGAIIGAEALIRWQHPGRGQISPNDFLPAIENHELSIILGEWVIDTALSQISKWQAAGLTLSISVNISAFQLQKEGFTNRLKALLSAHPDIAPHLLELEVLETSKLSDVTQVSKIMYDCIDLGVSFALDDFGTGYSSLTYLRRLPARLIKIDQSFVRDMLTDPDDLAIVEGVVGLAKSFKREVIAEGVETIEHGSELLKLECDLAQGYGIARPMPAKELPDWIKKWRPHTNWSA